MRLPDRMRVSVVALLAMAACAEGSPVGGPPSPVENPDAFQRSAAARELDTLARDVARFRDIDVARADGFHLPGGRAEHPLMGEHWYQNDRMELGFDLLSPTSLQFVTVDGERRFVGVSYVVYVDAEAPTPEGFTGAWDEWHRHRNHAPASLARAEARGDAAAGPMDSAEEVAMVHAWTGLPNPDGPFAPLHRALPYLRAGLDPALARSGDLAAAWGIALLDAWTCPYLEDQLQRRVYLSDANRRMLRGACRAAGVRLRSALEDPRDDAESVNGAAAAAWYGFDRAVLDGLDEGQRTQLERLGHTDAMEVPFGQLGHDGPARAHRSSGATGHGAAPR